MRWYSWKKARPVITFFMLNIIWIQLLLWGNSHHYQSLLIYMTTSFAIISPLHWWLTLHHKTLSSMIFSFPITPLTLMAVSWNWRCRNKDLSILRSMKGWPCNWGRAERLNKLKCDFQMVQESHFLHISIRLNWVLYVDICGCCLNLVSQLYQWVLALTGIWLLIIFT